MMRTIHKAVAIAAILIATSPVATAATPQSKDLTENFRSSGISVDRLQVYELAGVVILRGRTPDRANAEAIGKYASALGYTRVANLIQIVEHDDIEIARAAERELTIHRSLDGCRFRVTSEQGVVHVAGTVTHELQKDVAAQVLRSIDGVRGVEMNLDK
ncbi:MAG TPA: BON domain-containing protein [Thermoanaerobaculia bacterium]|nr:BON domain-containing protein [Thermoanaerobaculia bacterium]